MIFVIVVVFVVVCVIVFVVVVLVVVVVVVETFISVVLFCLMWLRWPPVNSFLDCLFKIGLVYIVLLLHHSFK